MSEEHELKVARDKNNKPVRRFARTAKGLSTKYKVVCRDCDLAEFRLAENIRQTAFVPESPKPKGLERTVEAKVENLYNRKKQLRTYQESIARLKERLHKEASRRGEVEDELVVLGRRIEKLEEALVAQQARHELLENKDLIPKVNIHSLVNVPVVNRRLQKKGLRVYASSPYIKSQISKKTFYKLSKKLDYSWQNYKTRSN